MHDLVCFSSPNFSVYIKSFQLFSFFNSMLTLFIHPMQNKFSFVNLLVVIAIISSLDVFLLVHFAKMLLQVGKYSPCFNHSCEV